MKRWVLAAIFSVTMVCAQEPEPFAWWDRPLARNLNLGADQQKQIQAAVREYRDRLIEQRASVQIAEGNLRDLMNEGQVNEVRTREAIDKVVTARGELMRTVSMMSLRMRLVLTPDQWQRVQRARGARAAQRRQAAAAATPATPAAPRRRVQPLPPLY